MPPPPSSASSTVTLAPLPPFKPDLYQRAWQSIPHPTLPLLATAHQKSVTVFSLSTLSAHSALTNGHERSVRSTSWKPNLPPHKLCLVTGSFDSTAGLWRWNDDSSPQGDDGLEVEVTGDSDSDKDPADKDWELIIILDGQDSEIKSVSFSPTGQFLATCSRDKSVWIWEDVGANEDDDEWETVAVLNEHEGDVKAVAWCPEVNRSGRRGRYSSDVLASASYDNTVRVWREESEQEWVCVAVLEGHEGTVWGLQWEPKPRGQRFPRLMSWSADKTVRIWTLKEEEDEEEDRPQHVWGGLGGIPNTMRRSLKEEWECTAVLPTAHTRDIYSAAWSPESGMVASTGSDGIIAVYREDKEGVNGTRHATEDDEAAAELDGDVHMTNGHTENGTKPKESESYKWKLLSTTKNAHGPYEVNHVTWCKRYDQGCPPERRGIEEMLVSTGDDGIVRPWQIIS
ncbi:WD40 repeat-like protein [Hypoxylon trugodes]|uniref:WD40 repeat-like protein n=1 Tax=Hypoxylon trugodes TaxID=326681 RepID=UPI002192FE6E|nr:WD40 repeat-like protein [Hypoxylon trugodes]KAI1388418.1 WD40 repeat-like protein [Hypoxylon trugodes]